MFAPTCKKQKLVRHTTHPATQSCSTVIVPFSLLQTCLKHLSVCGPEKPRVVPQSEGHPCFQALGSHVVRIQVVLGTALRTSRRIPTHVLTHLQQNSFTHVKKNKKKMGDPAPALTGQFWPT